MTKKDEPFWMGMGKSLPEVRIGKVQPAMGGPEVTLIAAAIPDPNKPGGAKYASVAVKDWNNFIPEVAEVYLDQLLKALLIKEAA